ncbi:UNVERIFIED_CONTAM: putative late blight resistance proteinR1A-4 [Sesamum latifolium]|uniref:Late blight resistance proteinR1A-4 n=1 Tax=Sesamum latifolium TaxID=2727402 RepID=A0AAW2VTA2_9LAMI
MAYNLESLVQILQQILHSDHHHPWTLDPNKRPQIQSLLQKSLFLKDLSDTSFSAIAGGYGKQSLESRIRDASHDAEDILESHLVEQTLSCQEDESFVFSPLNLEKVIRELDSAKEEMMTMIMSSSPIADSSSPEPVSSRQDPNPKDIIVGVGEDLIQLKDRLVGQPSKALQVIPIVGMGGIGKTTLARNLYDDPSVISHFDTHAWATISQDYNRQKLQDVLLILLGCVIGKPNAEMLKRTNVDLALHLHQALIGRRYLIVLDDMWDVKPWDDIRRFFPDKGNGSRIIVTTRESNVADYTASGSSRHQVNLLKDDESWNLLRQKVFAPEETCSSELEKVGKTIAKGCRGLPLAVHVIGGILSQAKRSQDFWEQVSDNVSSTIADKGEQFSNILSLSYNHLPNHLKSCFLYVGAFPTDYAIRSSRLINLLVAEGLVRPISDKSLEEAAEMYLKALVDRNLIFVSRKGTNGNVKAYSIHDLLRDLCVRKVHEEKFLFVDGWHPMISQETQHIIFVEFPEEILQLVNLRFLALTIGRCLPSSISRLCNLRTLIVLRGGSLSIVGDIMVMPGILDMTQLRHIKVKGQRTYIKYHGDQDKNLFVVLDKLQTLSAIAISELTDRHLDTLPNLEKLGIFWDEEVDHVRDLSRLHKLHTLTCRSSKYNRYNILSNIVLPPSIKKLTLKGCRILDHELNEIGKLPNLEILKLQYCYFQNGNWEAEDGEFCRLQFLLMKGLKLVNWTADDTHFPRLEHLVIAYCFELAEIPVAIGDIPTLKVMEVQQCGDSVKASAREIQEAQLDIGNDYLQAQAQAQTQTHATQQQQPSSNTSHHHPHHLLMNNLKTHFTNFINQTHTRQQLPWPGFVIVSYKLPPPPPSLPPLPSSILEQRLAGVPVYRIGTSSAIATVRSDSEVVKRDAAFYWLNKADGEDMLSALKSGERNKNSKGRHHTLQLIKVPLAELIQKSSDCVPVGVPNFPGFKLVPDISQVKNALQSKAVRMRVDGSPENLRRPVFFRKEDLINALLKENEIFQSHQYCYRSSGPSY